MLAGHEHGIHRRRMVARKTLRYSIFLLTVSQIRYLSLTADHEIAAVSRCVYDLSKSMMDGRILDFRIVSIRRESILANISPSSGLEEPSHSRDDIISGLEGLLS